MILTCIVIFAFSGKPSLSLHMVSRGQDVGRTVTVIVDVWAGPPLSWLMVLEGPKQAIDEEGWQGPEQAIELFGRGQSKPWSDRQRLLSHWRWLTENQWRLEKTTDVCTEDLLIGWRRLVWWEDKKAPGCMKVFKERLFPLQTISFLLAKLSLARPSLSGWL